VFLNTALSRGVRPLLHLALPQCCLNGQQCASSGLLGPAQLLCGPLAREFPREQLCWLGASGVVWSWAFFK
jgi:hypothetical protein